MNCAGRLVSWRSVGTATGSGTHAPLAGEPHRGRAGNSGARGRGWVLTHRCPIRRMVLPKDRAHRVARDLHQPLPAHRHRLQLARHFGRGSALRRLRQHSASSVPTSWESAYKTWRCSTGPCRRSRSGARAEGAGGEVQRADGAGRAAQFGSGWGRHALGNLRLGRALYIVAKFGAASPVRSSLPWPTPCSA